jgi:predicted nucleic acid-binding protein
MIVVDASALLEALLRTPATRAVEERLFEPQQTLHAPHLLDIEVAQVIRRYAAKVRVCSCIVSPTTSVAPPRRSR